MFLFIVLLFLFFNFFFVHDLRCETFGGVIAAALRDIAAVNIRCGGVFGIGGLFALTIFRCKGAKLQLTCPSLCLGASIVVVARTIDEGVSVEVLVDILSISPPIQIKN